MIQSQNTQTNTTVNDFKNILDEIKLRKTEFDTSQRQFAKKISDKLVEIQSDLTEVEKKVSLAQEVLTQDLQVIDNVFDDKLNTTN